MGLSITLYDEEHEDADAWGEVYSANITHNLTEMADKAGVYLCLWRGDENGYTHAKQLIGPLRDGIAKMTESAHYYKQFDAPNGWGIYDDFLPWLQRLREACETYPDATIETSR